MFQRLNCKSNCTKSVIGWLLLAFATLSEGETRQDMESWSYHQEWDKLTNVNYSLARSPLPRRGVYDTLRLEVVCKNKQLQFALDSYNLITSKGSAFDFDYQIDDNEPVALKMRTYPDTKRRGYTDEQVKRIVEDVLSGQSIFIRVHTIIRTVLSSKISLQGAAQPIGQVLADCGVTLPGQENGQAGYSLADFERDLKTLPPAQQRRLLDKIKLLLDEMR